MQDLVLVSLESTQRAPDALIERLGRIISASVNAKRLSNEKIVLNEVNMRRISLLKKETVVFVDGVPRRCILQHVCFAGATVYMMCVATFLKNKAVTLKFEFTDPDAVIAIKGKTNKATPLEDRKDLVSLNIEYTQPSMNYNLYLNRYFELPRKMHATDTEATQV